MNYTRLRMELNKAGIKKAQSGKATVNGRDAVLLRWAGDEHFYMGFELSDSCPDAVYDDFVSEWHDSCL